MRGAIHGHECREESNQRDTNDGGHDHDPVGQSDGSTRFGEEPVECERASETHQDAARDLMYHSTEHRRSDLTRLRAEGCPNRKFLPALTACEGGHRIKPDE